MSRWLCLPRSFDLHVTQWAAALYNGGRLVITPPGLHGEGETMMSLMVEQGVTFLMAVPVLGREYFSAPQAVQCTSLRSLMFCGEPLPPELVTLVFSAVRE